MKRCALKCAVAAAAAGLVGCSSCGLRFVAASRSTSCVGDINWEEYKLPVVGLYSGPSITLWVNKDYLALKKVKGVGTVTNEISVLGIYASDEQKRAEMELEFCPVPCTNAVPDRVGTVE